MNTDPPFDPATQRGLFLTTRWSLVLTAAGDDLAAPGKRALEELCRAYWRPLYGFARRQGMAPAEAEDATQGFFARLLARHDIAQADPERGRFRTFLITSFKNYLANQRRDARRLKRGGGELPITIDITEIESTLQSTGTSNFTPDRLYDRQWAEAVLEQAAQRLNEHYAASGKARHAELLMPFLWAQQDDQDCNNLAKQMEISPGAARVALHRARARFRELVRAEIAQTVLTDADVDAELRNLIEVLRGN